MRFDSNQLRNLEENVLPFAECLRLLRLAMEHGNQEDGAIREAMRSAFWHIRNCSAGDLTYFQALTDHASAQTQQFEAKRQLLLASLFLRADDPAAVLECTLRGREAAISTGSEADLASCSLAAGTASLRLGKYVEAKLHYEEARHSARRTRDAVLEAAAISNLALVTKNQGRLDAAEELNRQAIDLYESQGLSHQVARCQMNLAIIVAKRGHWAEAYELFRGARETLHSKGMSSFANNAQLGLARVARLLGRTDEARTLLQECAEVAKRQTDARGQALAWEFMGDVELELGNAKAALRAYESALEIAQGLATESDLLVETSRQLAQAIVAADGDLDHAHSLAQKAVELAEQQGDTYELGCSLLGLAAVLRRRRDYPRAHESASRGVALLRGMGDRFECAKGTLLLSKIAYDLDSAPEAFGLAMEAKRELEMLGSKRWSAEAAEWTVRLMADLSLRPTAGSDPGAMISATTEGTVRGFLTVDSAMRRGIATVLKLAPRNLNILILGESGTGKELIAQAIHKASERKGHFVPVNCSAFPGDLLEGELFGHSRGAYTGADRERSGLIEFANKGTLFLDEIGDMPLKAQARLLRALESGEVRRLGENSPRVVDVRVVAATHRELLEMVSAGEFRLDLYYRLAGYVLHLPPLREREGDAALLIDHFLQVFSQEQDKQVYLSPDIRHELSTYAWPGNVRELRNVMHRVVSLAEHGLTVRRLPFELDAAPRPRSLPEMLEAEERKRIIDALRAHNWNKTRAAAALGSNRTTLIGKMKRLGIRGPEADAS